MKLKLHWRILIGLVLGIVVGEIFYLNNVETGLANPQLGLLHLSHITWMGDLFLKLLQMIMIPIVVCSLTVGVGHLPVKSLGKIGIITLITFKGQMLLAAVLGLFFVNLIQPGKYFSPEQLVPGGDLDQAHFITESNTSAADFLINMVPSNIFSSLSSGTLIQVIVFSILAAIALVSTKNGEKILGIFKIFLDAILNITHWIMELAPFGVFALLTKAIAFTGLGILSKYAIFFGTVFGALFTMQFIVGSILVHFFTDFTPLQFFDKIKEVMMTAFSTSSSAATIPVTLENMEEEFGVPNRVASFVIPLGATMNMSGAAIYESIATLFVAQAFLPEPLTLSQQIFVVSMVLISTFGTPGIPHGSFITLAIVFKAVGLPLEAIGVILGIDRIVDMTRTMVNVSFDSISCLILHKYSHLEDEEFPENFSPIPEIETVKKP